MSKLTASNLAVCSWSLQVKSPAELATKVKDLGLTKVQLALCPVCDDPAVWGDANKVLADNGITVVSGMMGGAGEDYSTLETIKRTGGYILDEHWQTNLGIVRRVGAKAKEWGLAMVSGHAGFLPPDAQDPVHLKMLDRLAAVAAEFRKLGLTYLFETGQETGETLWHSLQALDQRGATNIGVNFDPANMILYDKGDPIAALQKVLPKVKQVHIKDAIKTSRPGTWGTEVPTGTGQVDWRAFVKTLNAGGYTGNLVIEREAGDDRSGDIRKAADLISRLLA